MVKKIVKLLPHACIVLSVMFLVFYVIDLFNRPMGFLDNDIFRTLLLIQCILVIVSSILFIALSRRVSK